MGWVGLGDPVLRVSNRFKLSYRWSGNVWVCRPTAMKVFGYFIVAMMVGISHLESVCHCELLYLQFTPLEILQPGDISDRGWPTRKVLERTE